MCGTSKYRSPGWSVEYPSEAPPNSLRWSIRSSRENDAANSVHQEMGIHVIADQEIKEIWNHWYSFHPEPLHIVTDPPRFGHAHVWMKRHCSLDERGDSNCPSRIKPVCGRNLQNETRRTISESILSGRVLLAATLADDSEVLT